MQHFDWTPAGNGVLVSAADPCGLTVATIGGLPRFLVHRQAPQAVGNAVPRVASGTRPSPLAAMAAAEATANHIGVAVGPPADAAR